VSKEHLLKTLPAIVARLTPWRRKADALSQWVTLLARKLSQIWRRRIGVAQAHARTRTSFVRLRHHNREPAPAGDEADAAGISDFTAQISGNATWLPIANSKSEL
jgi:hypothetical protein